MAALELVVIRVEQLDGSAHHVAIGRNDKLWRVPYRWRGAIAKLNGQTFVTKAALEAAMETA